MRLIKSIILLAVFVSVLMFNISSMLASSANDVWKENWESISNSEKLVISDIASNGSIFVGTGTDGMVYTSNDGFKWNMVPNNFVWCESLGFIFKPC